MGVDSGLPPIPTIAEGRQKMVRTVEYVAIQASTYISLEQNVVNPGRMDPGGSGVQGFPDLLPQHA